MATVGRNQGECAKPQNRKGRKAKMYTVGSNTNYPKQQIQNINPTLRCQADGEAFNALPYKLQNLKVIKQMLQKTIQYMT